MLLFEHIQNILDKWLINMTVNEQWELNVLRDKLLEAKAEEKNNLNILKQELKDYEAIRNLELSEELKEDWKKKYTVGNIEALILWATQERKTAINQKVFLIDKIEWKIEAVANYVINIRDYLNSNRQWLSQSN